MARILNKDPDAELPTDEIISRDDVEIEEPTTKRKNNRIEDLTETELKALAYDTISILREHEEKLGIINLEIQRRSKV